MRIPKTLCIVALSIGLTAIAGAAPAAASTLNATDYPAVLSGSGDGVDHVLDVAAGNIECDAPTFEAELSSASSTLETATDNTTCNFWGTPALQMNGCDFTFNFGSDAGHFGRFDGTVDIGPANCGPVTLASAACTITIPPQTGLAVSYENLPGSPRGVEVTADISGMEYTQKSSAGFCGNGTFTNGEYRGVWNISALLEGDEVYIEEDPHTPAFEAESYPASVSGAQNAPSSVTATFQGNKFECQQVSFAGSLAAASESVGVIPSYSQCVAFGFSNTTVNVNGCSFVFSAGEALGGGQYKGLEGVSCPSGKAIEIVTPSEICKVSIPSQSGLSSVTHQNTQKSGQEAVQGTLNVSSLSYTVVEKMPAFCPLTGGSFSNGKQSGSFTLQANTGGSLQGLRVGG